MSKEQSEAALTTLLADENMMRLRRLMLKDSREFLIKWAAEIRDVTNAGLITEKELRSFMVKRGSALIEAEDSSNPWKVDMIDVMDAYVPNNRWAVEGLLRAGSTSIIGAEPKCGKSTLMRWLTCCVLGGLPFLGREVKQGPVLYYCFEDPDIMTEDMINFSKGAGLSREELSGLVRVERHSPEGDPLEVLSNLLEEVLPVLIVVDTLNGFLQLHDNTNDYGIVSEQMSRMREVVRRGRWSGENSHMIFTHHTNKGGGGSVNSFMGSQAFRAATDANLLLVKDKRDRVTLARVEGRRLQPFPPGIITLSDDSMGFVEEGDATEKEDMAMALISLALSKGEGMLKGELVDFVKNSGSELGKGEIPKVIDRMYREGHVAKNGKFYIDGSAE